MEPNTQHRDLSILELEANRTAGDNGYWHLLRERFLSALLAGRLQECLAVSSELTSAAQLIPYYRYVIQPALYSVGEAWSLGKISIAQEHLASSIVGRVMTSLHVTFIRPSRTMGRAVVSAVTNEHHELGAWIVSDMLESDGWDVRYLGANTPVADLLSLLKRFRPHLLALSITMPDNVEQARRIIAELHMEQSIADTSVIVGGIAMNLMPGIWQEIKADGYAGDVEGAVEFARQMWNALSANKRL